MFLRKYKQILLVTLTVILLLTAYMLYDICYCDTVELAKMVETPGGKSIPYYINSHTMFKSYGELAGPCIYNSRDQIECTDVRLHGKSMNRQTLLVMARLHAVFDMVCKKRGLTYWLYSGSLIGAQRNGLMVPWDYDSDIGMMMDDFLKLLKYIRQDLPDDVYFETGIETPSMTKFCEARIRDRNSCYGHCLRTGCERHDGIQIDIFAYRPPKNQNSQEITNHYFTTMLNYNDIFPTTTIQFEGMNISAPRNATAVNIKMYGKNYMTLPPKARKQCHKNGYIAIPWYSCESLKAMSAEERKQILRTSIGHRNWWYWYIG